MGARRQVVAAIIGGAAIAALGASGAAQAAEAVVAKLQNDSGNVKIVAGGAVFSCLGNVCAAPTPTGDTTSLFACKELVRQVGSVSAFGSAAKPLSAEQLATCNSAAKK